MLRRFLIVAIALSLVLVAGCSRFTLDARDLGDPVCMNRNVCNEETAQVATQFEATTRVGYCGWVFNLVTLKDAHLSELIQKEVTAAGGSGVRNLTVKKEMTFVDGLISIASFGFYNPETITVTGEIVRD